MSLESDLKKYSLNISPNKPIRKSLSKEEKKYIFFRDKGRCKGCVRKLHLGIDEEFGHKKAVAKGGSSKLNNFVLLCRKCNHLQGTGSLSDLKRKLKNLKKYGRTKARKRVNKKSNGLGSFGIPKTKPTKLDFGLKF
jgi:5-methylcytosine-specific restriction endonuclease McrA